MIVFDSLFSWLILVIIWTTLRMCILVYISLPLNLLMLEGVCFLTSSRWDLLFASPLFGIMINAWNGFYFLTEALLLFWMLPRKCFQYGWLADWFSLWLSLSFCGFSLLAFSIYWLVPIFSIYSIILPGGDMFIPFRLYFLVLYLLLLSS